VQIIVPQTSKRIQIKHTHTHTHTHNHSLSSFFLSLTQITKALQLRAEGGKEQASYSRAGRRNKKAPSKQTEKQATSTTCSPKKNKTKQKPSKNQSKKSINNAAGFLTGWGCSRAKLKN